MPKARHNDWISEDKREAPAEIDRRIAEAIEEVTPYFEKFKVAA
jgi:hypothetical protein